MRLLAYLDQIEGVGTDHPGVSHSYCRLVGRQAVAFTRCCNLRVEFAPSWNCEIEQLPIFGVETTCCDRPYWMYGETTSMEVGQ